MKSDSFDIPPESLLPDDNNPFGRRRTDRMSGDVVESDGRYYIRGEHYMEIKKKTASMSSLLESTHSLMSVRDLDTLLTLILQHVTQVMKAERSSIFLLDTTGKELWSRVAQGTSEIRIPMGKGIAGHVAQTGEIVNIAEAYSDPRFRSEYDLITGFRTNSILCAPLRDNNDKIIGSLEVLNRTDGADFNKEDEDLLLAFVALASTAIVNARAYEELQREKEQLNDLIDSSRALMAVLDLNALLELILEKVTRVMRADRSTLFILDTKTNELVSRIAQGSDSIRIPVGVGIAGHTVKTGESINIRDAYSDERFNADLDRISGYYTKSILCAPIRDSDGKITGTIEVLNRLDETPFNDRDVSMLEAFASLAGTALANAAAHEALENERNNLETRVKERTTDLEKSMKQSDELLCNILPVTIANELKEHGSIVPRRYEMVTVMFTDFKDFSRIATSMDENMLVHELDRVFRIFDEVTDKYNLEKIKTIGDAYMCAGGIPEKDETNPVNVVLAAMEIRRFLNEEKQNGASSVSGWDMRIGIHTGPVIAGVVGRRKFAYDIWGPTVNMASRLESGGEIGEISLSSATYELIKPLFDCDYRGRIDARNVGEIDVYHLRRIKPEYSRDDKGLIPAESLLKQPGQK